MDNDVYTYALRRYYVGRVPHYLITDLDIAKEILMKHSDIFMDRIVSCNRLYTVYINNMSPYSNSNYLCCTVSIV